MASLPLTFPPSHVQTLERKIILLSSKVLKKMMNFWFFCHISRKLREEFVRKTFLYANRVKNLVLRSIYGRLTSEILLI